MTIGERAYKAISDHADQKGVGIVAYAKSIGISQPNLVHWKNARSEPRAYLLSLMAEAGLDVHWILTGQEGGKVEVVRCKDCKHFDMQCMECHCNSIATDNEGGADYTINFYLDDFCSYGERRSDNG